MGFAQSVGPIQSSAVKGLRWAVLAVAAGLLGVVPPAAADPAPNTVVPADAVWSEEYITEPDGTVLHADVLRPKHLAPGTKTPVILAVGPYFNHAGQGGVFGQVSDLPPYGLGTSVGASTRFLDLLDGARLMARGYTFVMVDSRGTGGSTGCPDFIGPGEQADVDAAIRWAATQPWSTGKVGMYGKSYDGTTGLVGVGLRTPGLAAVVAQEPMYDLYRWLFYNGVRYHRSPVIPAWYTTVAATPGVPGADSTRYMNASVENFLRPSCLADAALSGQDGNWTLPYWRSRDIFAKLQGSTVPLFLMQGFLESNTRPDGLVETMQAVQGPRRAWLGMWNHVRGNETDANGAPITGREGWFDEVMRFYDEHLKGIVPAQRDPAVVVQSSDGRWRREATWPPAQPTNVVAPVARGSYLDLAPAFGAGANAGAADVNKGLWTVSAPLPGERHLAGMPSVVVNARSPFHGSNVTVDVYDVADDGTGVLVTRGTALTVGADTMRFNLLPTDWRFARGHRIAVRLTNANFDWWLHVPNAGTVTVDGGQLTLPLTCGPEQEIAGLRSSYLDTYVSGPGRYQVPAEVLRAPAVDFAGLSNACS